MRLFLGDTLALVGRLTDQPGFDTARERFRRFLSNWPGSLDDLCALVDDAQRAPDEQVQRALLDLVVTLGRYLGFDVTYGTYERSRGAVRFDGAWRSHGLARLVLEVRTDRTRPFSPSDLERTIKALPDVEPRADDEVTLGLCVLVPLHGARRAPGAAPSAASAASAPSAQDEGLRADIRIVPLDVLLAMAERVVARTLTHEDVIEMIRAGRHDPRMVELWPRAEEDDSAAEPVRTGPHLSLVPREQPPDYWIATILSDDGTTPAQFVEAVINGRQLLGVSTIGIFPAHARAGDWVCFFLRGIGVVGHALLGAPLDARTALLRGAERFAAVFPLSHIASYHEPSPLDHGSPAQRLADRTPFGPPGPFLSPIPERDFRLLTEHPPAHGLERVAP